MLEFHGTSVSLLIEVGRRLMTKLGAQSGGLQWTVEILIQHRSGLTVSVGIERSQSNGYSVMVAATQKWHGKAIAHCGGRILPVFNPPLRIPLR